MKIDIELSKKQTEAMGYLLDNKTKTVVYGGSAGGGKTWLACTWLIIMCFTYENTKWFIGRAELKVLKESTFVTFVKVSNLLKITDKWKYNAQSNNITFNNGSVISLISLENRPSDPLFERFGSTEYTGGFIEEAGEVNFQAFDTLKSRTGRQYNEEYGLLPKILITCNPKKNWLYSMYYKPFKAGTLPEDSQFIQALVTDNPKIAKSYIDNLHNLKNEVQKQRLLYGVWEYEDEPDQLINYTWVEKAFYNISDPGKQCLGVDVARYGNDYTCFAKFNGNTLVELLPYKDYDVAQIAQMITDKLLYERIDSDRIGIDTVGLGAGVYDILKRDKYKCREIISGETPKVFNETDTYNFYNLRSQMWWVFREDLRNGNIRFNLEPDHKDTQKLIEDITAPCYEIRGEKTIKVESKDDIKQRIGRSTDLADAVVYANWIRNIENKRVKPNNSKIYQAPARSLSECLF